MPKLAGFRFGATMAHRESFCHEEPMGYLLTPSHLLLVSFIGLIALAVTIPPYWMIFKKAGFSPWLSLLTLLPLVKWIVLWGIGISKWKAGPTQTL